MIVRSFVRSFVRLFIFVPSFVRSFAPSLSTVCRLSFVVVCVVRSFVRWFFRRRCFRTTLTLSLSIDVVVRSWWRHPSTSSSVIVTAVTTVYASIK